MTLDNDLIIWGILPAVLGLLILGQSFRQSLQRKTSVSWIFTLLIGSVIGLAEVMMYRLVFENAYASFVPHLLILSSFLLLGLQSFSKAS